MRLKPLIFALMLPAAPAFALGEGKPSQADVALIARMDQPEQDYYGKLFTFMMESLKPGETYSWKSYASNGKLTAGELYAAGDTACRNFSETMVVKGITGDFNDGIGCRRVGREGWCRLHQGDALTCGLEPPADPLKAAIRGGREWLEQGTGEVRSLRGY